jgi:ABC-type transporter Mla subunit MlaD
VPTPSERRRNNVKAGIFVIVALALAAATMIALTDIGESLLRPQRTYTVTFSVADGVNNLKTGSEVKVGGVLMGRVAEVRPRIENGGIFEMIDVEFSLDAKVPLYRGARIVISSALIGSDAWLDIYSVGDRSLGPPQDTILGISAAGALAALLGPDNADKADEMIENFRTTSEKVRDLSERITDEDWPRWASRVDHVMEWSTEATGKIDAVLDEGQGFLTDTRGVVNENREGVRTIVQNLESTSGKMDSVMTTVRDETVDKVHKLLDTGQSGLDSAVAVLESLNNDYQVWATEIAETLAGARLTAQQLKLASIEVRRSPWKLLYRPKRTELEHELLYEAARAFALAGSDLKASSASAERIIDRHGEELEPDTVRQINDFLSDSLNRYDRAQQRLVDVLVKE